MPQPSGNRLVRQEPLDPGLGQPAGMPLTKKQDEPLDQPDIRSLGAPTVVFERETVANTVQQSGTRW